MQGDITSRLNERIKHACRVAASAAFRRETGLLFAEGKRLCLDLAAAGLVLETVFYTADFSPLPPGLAGAGERFIVSTPVAERLGDTGTPQGLFCLFRAPQTGFEHLRPEDGILLCEQVQDPGNIGTMLRSAAAFGFGGAVLCGGTADPFSPKALRASMGAVARLPINFMDIAEATQALRAAGLTIYAAALCDGATPLSELRPNHPAALMVGNEGAGLSSAALAAADKIIYIPMQSGIESLNAAAAAAVLMYSLSCPAR